MSIKNIVRALALVLMVFAFSACKSLSRTNKEANTTAPNNFFGVEDTTNSAAVNWNTFFTDPYLTAIIDSALSNNQELNIILQEIEMSKNEVSAKKGEYLPSLSLGVGADVEKVGRYTSQGANDANTDIEPGREMPDPLGNLMVGAYGEWEIDIWKKLRNAKKSAMLKYLSSMEGRNFMVTHLVGEISMAYYELLALDNQLAIVQQNLEVQSQALEIVKLQKESAKVTELAVKRFEAEVLKNSSKIFYIKQEIVEMESEICFLMGVYPRRIARAVDGLMSVNSFDVDYGVPSQLLKNRPDIKQAELELEASKLDVKVARARFYPSLKISAGIGLEAFNPTFLIKSPQSLLYTLAGELMAPLLNRKAIKAVYYNASAKQIQAVYNYEQTILKAYVEVYNQISKMDNLEMSFMLQDKQVEVLDTSIVISNDLFSSARADYMEVLLTQREALQSKLELVETRQKQFHNTIMLYQSLGGGWK